MSTGPNAPAGFPGAGVGEMTYVYAVGHEGPALDGLAARLPGVDGRPLRPVGGGGLCALVSAVPADTFSERGLTAQMEDLDRLEAVARAHHAVVDAAFAETSVLPMRLATVYLDDARVADMLVRQCSEFRELLGRLEGHVELGMKVYADPRAAAASAPATPASAGAGAGRAYLRQRQAQQRDSQDAYRSASDLAARAARLADGVAASRAVHRPQQGRLAASRPGVNVANEAYLVPREHTEQLRRELSALAEDVPGVFVEVTGPWAPYSFATAVTAESAGGGGPR
ncbi:GvpL/GvpF family gas vesicle protein [Streptomyces sp. ADI98-10]|uniref:GvpL/GvpF family gas vesicle protein n=1 Tax=Streptomyces sp. ADI98-10 TaxID=1522763 RepID=UPI000F54CEB3|nr:GvpL/GvpF family gas vesicle protein [Streptomyces sp. ADI98-10]RPK81775.1 Gas vesicle synthesis protein GvpL/GvpF [Streptomyces sp. ADI98-10]